RRVPKEGTPPTRSSRAGQRKRRTRRWRPRRMSTLPRHRDGTGAPIPGSRRRRGARPGARAPAAAGGKARRESRRGAPPPWRRGRRARLSGGPGALVRCRGGRHLLAGAAEAPLAAGVGGDRLVERRGVEIRPQRLGEVELGVGELPEEEVADALLAARADKEIGLRRVAHREVLRQRRLVYRPLLD